MNQTSLEPKVVGLKEKAIRGAGINIAAQSIEFVLQTGGVIVLTRILTPQDFGVVAMVTAFSLLLMNFGVNGFTEFIIQKEKISEEEINCYFWLHVLLAGILSIGFTLFGHSLVKFYGEPALWGIAAAMSSSFFLYALFTCHLAILKREMKFSTVALIELIAGIMSVIIPIGLAIIGGGYWAVVARHITIPLVILGGTWLFSSWHPRLPRDLRVGFSGLKYAVKVYCNFILGYLTRNIDKVLLGRFHGAAVLGTYDRAYYLSSLPVERLLTPLDSVALATLSRLKNDSDKFLVYYLKALSLVAMLGTLCSVVLMVTAQDLIHLLLGPAWAETGVVVVAFAPCVGGLMIFRTISWLHLSLGTPGRWFRWNIIVICLTVIGFIIAVPYGAVAMAIAYSVRSYVLMMPGLCYAGRPVKLSLKKLFYAIWVYLASAVVVCSIWFYFSSQWVEFYNYFKNLITIIRIILSGFVSVGLYVVFVVLFDRSFRSIIDVYTLIKDILPLK